MLSSLRVVTQKPRSDASGAVTARSGSDRHGMTSHRQKSRREEEAAASPRSWGGTSGRRGPFLAPPSRPPTGTCLCDADTALLSPAPGPGSVRGLGSPGQSSHLPWWRWDRPAQVSPTCRDVTDPKATSEVTRCVLRAGDAKPPPRRCQAGFQAPGELSIHRSPSERGCPPHTDRPRLSPGTEREATQPRAKATALISVSKHRGSVIRRRVPRACRLIIEKSPEK